MVEGRPPKIAFERCNEGVCSHGEALRMAHMRKLLSPEGAGVDPVVLRLNTLCEVAKPPFRNAVFRAPPNVRHYWFGLIGSADSADGVQGHHQGEFDVA